jgi:DNA-binding NtrC family response regulator
LNVRIDSHMNAYGLVPISENHLRNVSHFDRRRHYQDWSSDIQGHPSSEQVPLFSGNMSGHDNTPMIDFGARRDDDSCPILICAGQSAATAKTDGARIIEINSAIELGRGQTTGGGLIRRFETADPHMSRSHALFRRLDDGSVMVRDLESRNGILVNGAPVVGELLLTEGAVLFIGAHVFVFRTPSREDLQAVSLELARPFGPVPTLSPTLARMFERLRRLARSEVDILLGGETGVGKEIVANAIHRESGRAGQFVAINCAALPHDLLESELFGYARGAHPMAEQSKAGLIEQAEGGTLFLDEIGEMSPSAQSKLLRFLQDRMILPLGDTRPRRLDVRVVAATRRAVAANDDSPGIRFDLAARLGQEPLVLPPLRARPEDIGILARYFLRDFPWSFDVRSYRALFLHQWSGNVRELEKTLRMAAVLSEGRQQIAPEYLALAPGALTTLPEVPRKIAAAVRAAVGAGVQSPRPTRDLLAALLEEHAGNVAEMARTLNRQRTLVWRWLRKAGLDPSQFRGQRNADPPT